jgi:hypothetical protein
LGDVNRIYNNGPPVFEESEFNKKKNQSFHDWCLDNVMDKFGILILQQNNEAFPSWKFEYDKLINDVRNRIILLTKLMQIGLGSGNESTRQTFIANILVTVMESC